MLNGSNVSSNDTRDSDYYFTPPDLRFAVPVGVILGLFTILTVGGNLLVLLAVGTDRQLRSQRHTLLIANLAIFDMTLGWSVFPFSASREFLDDQWIFGRVFCSVWAAVDVLCCTGSICIMTRRKMMYMVACIWILSLTISVVPFMGWSKPEQRNPFKCDLQTDLSYVLFSCAVSYYIPLIIILVLYSRIYRAAARHVQSMRTGVKRGSINNNDGTVMTLRIHTRKFMKADPASGGSSTGPDHHGEGHGTSNTSTKFGKTFAKQRKATITLTTIIVGFICMWQGFFLILPISVLCSSSCEVPFILWKILFWLGYCNSLMNPFIYAAASPEFRRAFKRILCCRFLSDSKRKRNLRYEMSISSLRTANTTATSASHDSTTGERNRHPQLQPRSGSSSRTRDYFRLCRPCSTCLSAAKETNVSSDALDSDEGYHQVSGKSPSHTLSSTSGSFKGHHFLGFRLGSLHKTHSSGDLLRDFPLGSLTLARLKNPNNNGEALYGSLQALQKVALEQSPSRVRHNSIVIVTNGVDVPLMTASRSFATQTPPASISVSPETSSPHHCVFEPSAPDDAEL